MKKTMAMTFAMLGWAAVDAAGRQPLDNNAVRVQVYYDGGPSVAVNVMVLSLAQARASQLLADASIQLEWHPGKTPAGEDRLQAIGITLLATAPPDFCFGDKAKALAAGRPYGNS